MKVTVSSKEMYRHHRIKSIDGKFEGKKGSNHLAWTSNTKSRAGAAQPCCCPQSTWAQEEIGLTQGWKIQPGWVNKSVRTIIHTEVHVLKNMLHQETLQPQFKDSHSECYSSLPGKSKQVPPQTESESQGSWAGRGSQGSPSPAPSPAQHHHFPFRPSNYF